MEGIDPIGGIGPMIASDLIGGIDPMGAIGPIGAVPVVLEHDALDIEYFTPGTEPAL